MPVDNTYLVPLKGAIEVKLTCAERTLPFALRTGDFYALRAEGRSVTEQLGRAITQPGQSGSKDELALRGYDYHQRLAMFLEGTEDSHACGVIAFSLGPPPVEGVPDLPSNAPPASSNGAAGFGKGILWGLGLSAIVLGTGWYITR